jgi:Lon protease-like protein
MPRELPPRPNLEHLKKQAKELLHAHQAGEADALERIREHLPALAGSAPEQIAQASFALHDAQSVIAREYGFHSWNELREAVAARATPFSEANMRTLLTFSLSPIADLPSDVFAAMRDAHAARELAEQACKQALPARLPLLAVRNALLLRPTISPLQIGRPSSLASLHTALAQTPSTAVTFAQRSAFEEDVRVENLYPIGCQVLVHKLLPIGGGQAHTVVEALRLVELRGLDPAEPGETRFARIAPFTLDTSTGAQEMPELERRLRSCARRLATALPEPESALATIDAMDQLDLASSIVQNLPRSVADKAQFATERQLVEKLRLALSWAEPFGAA